SSFQDPKRDLQKLGIRIVDVMSTEFKNSADIELSLSVQETIITREDISTAIIFSGDRDYMPIANRARERGKNLHFVGFEKSLSGDLKYLVGDKSYSYARPEDLQNYVKSVKLTDKGKVNGAYISVNQLTPDQARVAIAAIDSYDKYREKYGNVKVSIFLVEGLAQTLPDLDHMERKNLFRSLEETGIIEVEKRKLEYPDPFGNMIFFTVFMINENSTIVKEFRKNRNNSSTEGEDLLRKAALSAADENGNVLGAKLGMKLRELDPGFVPAKYGFVDLTEFVDHFPKILVYEGMKSGEDRKYRLMNFEEFD
ncbi:protein containing DUF88, partial [mine drainage metagenome]